MSHAQQVEHEGNVEGDNPWHRLPVYVRAVDEVHRQGNHVEEHREVLEEGDEVYLEVFPFRLRVLGGGTSL